MTGTGICCWIRPGRNSRGRWVNASRAQLGRVWPGWEEEEEAAGGKKMAGEGWDGEWRSETEYGPRFCSINPAAAPRSLLYINHFFPPSLALLSLSSKDFSVSMSRFTLNSSSLIRLPTVNVKVFACVCRAKPVFNISCCFHSFKGDPPPPRHLFHSLSGNRAPTLLLKSELWLCRHVGLKWCFFWRV